MGAKHLMDSNAIIDYLEAAFPANGLLVVDEILKTEINISVINQIDLLSFLPSQKNVTQRIQDFISFAHVFPLDVTIAMQTLEICKKHQIKLPNAIIAATAIHHNLILITNNEKDFASIKGLKMNSAAYLPVRDIRSAAA